MSVAGKREGIKHSDQGDDETTRSGLFYEAVRIIKEMRDATNGEYPKYAVWENVPGAFSSNKGHDFHAVLEALCSVKDDAVSIPEPCDAKRTKLVWNNAGEIVGDNYSVAWRTLDAQYWGVPQRRKRIYLVADFTGRRAGEILFKPDSLRGNLPQSDEAGQGSTADAVGGVDGSVGVECLNPWDSQTIRQYDADGIYPALNSNSGGGQNRQGVVFSFDSLSSNSMKSSNPFSGCRAVDVAKCIDTTYPDPSKNQGGVAVRMPINRIQRVTFVLSPPCTVAPRCVCSVYAVGLEGDYTHILVCRKRKRLITPQSTFAAAITSCAFFENERLHHRYDARNHNAQDISGTIQAKTNGGQSLNYINPVCYDARGNGDCAKQYLFENHSQDTRYKGPLDVSPIVSATFGMGGNNQPFVIQEEKPPRRYIIRRLTPTECARLQGFPDNWGQLAPYDPADAEFWEDVRKTHAEINGKKYKPVKDIKKWYDKLHTDSAEYKMWGNGIALPNARYVLEGIAEQGAKTLGSLFDGSGGFPLAGALNGISPLWSSEVEPYPIAVTKSRFREVHNGRNV